ncbi:MAG: trehalose/maltose transport system substrate-binding protein [Verrucomicrobiota bacterium]
MRFSAHLEYVLMHKNAVPPNTLSSPDLSAAGTPNGQPASGVNRREFIKRTGLALAGATAVSTFVGPRRVWAAGPVELTFASAKFYGKQTIAEVVNAFNGSQSKIHVTYKELPPPSSSTEVHQTLVQQLARRNGDPDVFTQDIIWIAEFAAAKWALPLDEYFKDSAKDYFSGMVQACTWQGKLTALPWFVDSGMLYYRKDLGFNAPTSWQELIASAKQATSSGGVKFGFLWQAKQAEVLVCDLVSFIGSNGGAILQPDGKTVSIADEPAVEAVQLMRDLISKEQITPADVLSWDEEPSRRPFTAGEAAFLRNWSYVWKIAQSDAESKVVDKVAVVPLPHFPNKKSAAALGGYQYGINASSKKREGAAEFVRWMSSPETQLRFATQLGLCPTRAAVFDRPEIAKEQAFMQPLKDVFLGAIPRPVTPKYPQVTLVLQSEVSRALTHGNVKEALQTAKEKITTIVKA